MRTSNATAAAVKANPTDEGVATWFRQTAKPHQSAELDAWNQQLLARGPSSPESAERFKKYRDAVDPSRTDITAWSDLQDLEEGRPVAQRSPAGLSAPANSAQQHGSEDITG